MQAYTQYVQLIYKFAWFVKKKKVISEYSVSHHIKGDWRHWNLSHPPQPTHYFSQFLKVNPRNRKVKQHTAALVE